MENIAGESNTKPIGPRKLLTEWIFLLVFSSIGVFGSAEIYLRFTSPHIIRKSTTGPVGKEILAGEFGYFDDTFRGRRHIPNSHVVSVWGDGLRIPIDINAYGFRGEDFSIRKGDHEKRALVLGDSITFADKVMLEDTYTSRLEFFLNHDAGPDHVRCMNGGVSGIGMKDEVDILIEQGLAVSPDIVVIGFYLNDGMPPDRLAAGLANPGYIRRHSVLAQTIFRAYKFHRFRSGTMKEALIYDWINAQPPKDWRSNRASFFRYAATAGKDWGSAWDATVWQGIAEQMGRLKKLAEEYRFKVVLICFPVSFQVETEYVEDAPQQRLGSLAEKFNFYFLDLLPVFRAHAGAGELFTDHCHLTKKGHNLVGKELARSISMNALLR